MNNKKPEQMINEQTPDEAQTVAESFISQFTDEDFYSIRELDEAGLKQLLVNTAAENLRYATHILPGRPDRPKKPTW